ncbi:hypothetical protein D3C78_1550000 [compost metagenome]
MLELNGNISVLRTPNSQPVTREDLNLIPDKQTFPIELVMDGTIMEKNLRENQLTKQWLQTQIKNKGLAVQQINYAVISSNGSLYMDTYTDQITSPIDKE